MTQIFKYLIAGIAFSFYLFPIGLSFLPDTLNTKNIMAILGFFFLGYDWIQTRKITITRELLGALIFTLVFSFICFYAADYNQTSDYTYSSYYMSFFTWLGGAYGFACLARWAHGEVNLRVLAYYFAAVCAIQCVLAILIDRIPTFQLLVDSLVVQGQAFYQEVGRLYGIGAALDPAGVRFSVALLVIAGVLSRDSYVRASKRKIILMVTAFFIIAVIGNMISRTTVIGVILGLVYLILTTGILQLVIKKEYFKFHVIFGGILIAGIAISAYLYNTDEAFHTDMRFAFEGFFNWVEHGEFRTDSTDKLNREMWVWPTDLKTWIIGSGTFGMYVFSTDVGYCRFILYCGLVGFSVFALFFIYNSLVFAAKFKEYRLFFLFFIAVTFVVWLKVATDIFFFFALCYCMDNTLSKSLAKDDA